MYMCVQVPITKKAVKKFIAGMEANGFTHKDNGHEIMFYDRDGELSIYHYIAYSDYQTGKMQYLLVTRPVDEPEIARIEKYNKK